MAELSTPENEKLISDVYTKVLEDRAADRRLRDAEQVVYEVEMLSQEVNSALTQWSPAQEEQLQALADEFSEHNGTITNALAGFYRRSTS